MKLDAFDRETLEEAVRIYLHEAYADAELPRRARKRLDWPPGQTVAEMAEGGAFERQPSEVPPEECSHVRLRLGNAGYPNMKLSLDRVPDTDEWVLSVDCHDKMLMEAATQSDAPAVRELIEANNELKMRIERQWSEAGLPTFEQYVRRRLRDRAPGPAADADKE